MQGLLIGIANAITGMRSGIASAAATIFAAYKARVIADGGVVENDACAIAFLESIGAGTDIIPSFSFLLDTYSGAAAAYSLRQLSSSYSGDAIRVRRASDNAEFNIGFVANELDTSALTTFASGTDAFVTTWYDQSGSGNDATQTTASAQPKIVSVGSTILENGKAAAQFDGINDGMQMNTLFNLSNITTSFVFSAETGQDAVLFEVNQNVSNFIAFGIGNIGTADVYGTRFRVSGVDYNAGESGVGGQKLALHIANQSTPSVDLYLNNTEATGNQSSRAGAAGSSSFGYRSTTGNPSDAKIQEFVVYELDQSSNQAGIETNINSYYSIY
jgi:hypothetical protein